MDSMALGSAASLEEVAKAMVAGSATAERNRRSGTRKSIADGRSTSKAKAIERDVQRKQQFAEIDQNAEPHLPDGKGHRSAYADGGEVHDEIGELEHHLAEAGEQVQHGRALLAGKAGQGDAEEDGEDGDLEDLAFSDGLGDVFGEDVEEEILPVDWARGRERSRRRLPTAAARGRRRRG